MNNSNTMPFTHLTNIGNALYLKAKKYGFTFCDTIKIFTQKTADKEAFIESLPERPSFMRNVQSIAAIFVAIILAIVETTQIRTAISSIGNFSETTAMWIGTGLSLVGIITGEKLHAGLKRNEYTNKLEPTFEFWLAALLGVMYMGAQAGLAYKAAGGDSSLYYLIAFAIGISAIEILVGYLYLKNALHIISVFFQNIHLKYLNHKLKSSSRTCANAWHEYTFTIENENAKHGTAIPLQEEVEAIKQARSFYENGGFNS